MWLNICSKKLFEKHVSFVHDGKRQFRCEVCDYKSSQKCDINKHIASVHEANRPLKYDICDYSCSQNSKSNENVESVHEGKKIVQM